MLYHQTSFGGKVGGQFAPLWLSHPLVRPLLGRSVSWKELTASHSFSFLGKPSVPTGHWPRPRCLRLRHAVTLCFSAGWGQAGQEGLAGGAGLVLRRLAPGPTPLPAGRLGRAAAWTSSKAQQGPLCAAASLSPSASTRPSGASVPFCVPERRGGGSGEETHFSGQLSFQLRRRRSLR